MRLMDSNGNVSMVAKAGAPLYINLRDPFIEAIVPSHLLVQVNALPEEKMMPPSRVSSMTSLSFDDIPVL